MLASFYDTTKTNSQDLSRMLSKSFSTPLKYFKTPLKIFLDTSFHDKVSPSMKLILTALMFLSLFQRNAMAFAPKFLSLTRPSVATFSTRTAAQKRVISDEVLGLINSQVTVELSASQLYLSASIWCDQNDLIGMASFMRLESDDERSHALQFVDFANKRNTPVKLENLEAPDAKWTTPEDLWEKILQAEVDNTQSLLVLGDAAANCNDHALTTFLMPFHMAQVDSEDNIRTILAKVRDENKTPGLIRQLDSELGQEVKSAPGTGSHTSD